MRDTYRWLRSRYKIPKTTLISAIVFRLHTQAVRRRCNNPWVVESSLDHKYLVQRIVFFCIENLCSYFGTHIHSHQRNEEFSCLQTAQYSTARHRIFFLLDVAVFKVKHKQTDRRFWYSIYTTRKQNPSESADYHDRRHRFQYIPVYFHYQRTKLVSFASKKSFLFFFHKLIGGQIEIILSNRNFFDTKQILKRNTHFIWFEFFFVFVFVLLRNIYLSIHPSIYKNKFGYCRSETETKERKKM